MTALADRLEREGRALSLRAIAAMYDADPFWSARFGERGRRFADEDAGRHLEHLVATLRAGTSAVFVSYARWLRSLLTTRGMSTAHVVENFRRFADEIEAARWPDRAPAIAALRDGIAALRYEAGVAGELESRRTALVAAVVPSVEHVPRLADELVDYLIDAVANHHPACFAAHVAFARRFRGPTVVDNAVTALDHALDGCTGATAATARGAINGAPA